MRAFAARSLLVLVLIAMVMMAWAFHGRARAESGIASWYGGKHHGRKTASGERFNQHDLTCAHRSAPFGTVFRVTYRGRTTTCRTNDRGPFVRGRSIDLSAAAARAIRLPGVGRVTLTRM